MERTTSHFISRICVAALMTVAVSLQAAERKIEKFQAEKGSIEIEPVNHASFIVRWNGKTIFVDPVGGATKFNGKPDIALVTDIHGDHFNADTLKGVVAGQTRIVAPQAVIAQFPEELKGKALAMANGEKKEIQGISIEAVPMYNLTEERKKFHAKGRGNGYVLSLGGKRIYISGDTEDIPEMRALKDIDVAFVCMNLPYTMTPEQAASAVKEFKPKVVYPYHYRGSDVEKFKQLVGDASEVRLVDWYAK